MGIGPLDCGRGKPGGVGKGDGNEGRMEMNEGGFADFFFNERSPQIF